jgi:hypothetical protein
MEDVSLLPDEAAEAPIESVLPDPPAEPPTLVLKNDQEVAGMLALASNPADFSKSFKTMLPAVQAGNHAPILSDILVKEKEENIQAARAAALSAAQAYDVQKARLAIEQERQLQNQSTDATTDPTRALHAASVRALEETGLEEAARRWRDFNAVNKAIDGASASFVTRQLLSAAASKTEESATSWDKVKAFFTDIIPGITAFDNRLLAKHFGEKVGESFVFNTYAHAQAIRDVLMNLPPSEQQKLLEAVVTDTSMNPARKADLLRKLAEMTKEEFVADSAFRLLDATLVGDALKLLSGVARKGLPGKLLKDVAGEDTAGKAVAADILNKTNITGWTNEELVARALAAGKMPFDIDPAAAAGLNASTQKMLRDKYNSMLDEIQSRLNSSGMTKEEMAKAAGQIRDSYMQSTDKSLYDVHFGEASVDGQKVTLFLQDNSGKVFLTKEAAVEHALREGIVDFKVVPVTAARMGPIHAQTAFHGGSVVNKFDDGFIGSGEGWDSLGWGHYLSPSEAFAEKYASRFGGRLSSWDIPETSTMVHWDAPFAEQPAVVQKAASKLLKMDEDVLRNMAGSDIYNAVKDKFGSAKAASQRLYKEGVKGNYQAANPGLSRTPEYVVFNAKDAKFKFVRDVEETAAFPRVEEPPIEVDGQVFFNMARADAQGLPVPKANGNARTAFDKGEKLFQDGKTLEHSDAVHDKYGKVMEGWMDFLHFPLQDRVLLIEAEDIALLHKRLGLDDQYWKEQFLRLYVATKGANGTHTYIDIPTGKNTHQRVHIITVNDSVLKGRFSNWLPVMAHEFGHAFDRAVLAHAPVETRKALFNEFKTYMLSVRKDTPLRQFVGEYRSHSTSTWDSVMGGTYDNATVGQLSRGSLEWYGSFAEWWAENFAKYMMTETRPVGIVAQFFYDHVQKLKAFFAKVAAQFGDRAVKPSDLTKKFLDEYLDRGGMTYFPLSKNPIDDAIKEAAGVPISESMRHDTSTLLGGTGRAVQSENDVGALLRPREEPSAPGWVLQVERTDPYSYYAIGKFSDKDIESMPFFAIDPKHRASEQAVEARVVGVHGEAKVRKEFTDFIMPFYKKLSRAGVQRVEALLKDGDSYSNLGGVGREFTATEAMARGLSHDEAAAYLATRQLRMAMYFVKNKELVQHMRASGLKEVELTGTGIRTAGSRLSEDMAVVQLGGKQVYDYLNLANKKVTADSIRELYAQGKSIIRLAKPVNIEGELRRHLIVDAETAKVREIQTALSYRPGEYARIYSDEYFITRTVNRMVDGELQPVTEVLRTAASAREADEFVTGVKAAIDVLKNGGGDDLLQRHIGRYFDVSEFRARYAEGEFDGMTDLSHHFTRNQEEYLNGSVREALAYGRTFYSERNEKVMGMNPLKENTLGVFESLEREITNTSRVANITQWREQMVRRWMNTFGDLIPNRTGDDVADFFSAADAHFTAGGKEAQFAQRTHRYIMRQIGLRTQEERLYEQVTRQLTEKFFTGNEKIESVGAKIRQMGVLGFIRNINFNLNLGMFNPAQLIVQANGAATALILSPMHGAAAAKTFPLLRMALMSDNPDVWKFMGKIDATLFGDADEFQKLVKAVRQTGIIDNIRSTALHNLEDGKLNIFNGYPQRVLGSHAFFFNRGEEFARLVSFDVARREWMAANKGMDWTSKEALAQILVRQDDLTQNMTRANLARFQEGALSIPMQFAQYNIKLAANVMSALLGKGEGRGFTKTEALTLMGGHILLYGAAGNGIAWLVDELMSKDTKESLSETQKTYIAQGLLSGLLNQVGEWFTGEKMNVALGSRLGAFDYYHQLGKAIFTDPKNIYEALLGPTVGTAKRWSVAMDVAKLMWKDPNRSGQDVLEGLAQLTTEQVATLRNAAKAYLYTIHQGKMLDKNGVAVGKVNSNEILAQALGFQPTMAMDVHNLIQAKKDHNEALDDIARLIMKVQRDIMTARLRGDHKYAEEQHKLLTALWPENAGDVQAVRTRIRDRLYPYDSEFQKLLGEYMWKGQTYDQPMVVTQPPRNTNGK